MLGLSLALCLNTRVINGSMIAKPRNCEDFTIAWVYWGGRRGNKFGRSLLM